MFDMLDDDLEDVGYVPTMANSRSGNMKKITKKQPKAPAKQTSTKAINNKSNDFDDLLDDIMDFDLKKPAKQPQTKPAAPKKNMFNSLDSDFQDPKPTSVEKPKPAPIKENPSITANTSKAAFLKFDQVDEIIQEDHNSTSFGKTQPAFFNPSKVQEPFVSSRNMKPPISKKKNEPATQSVSFGNASMGLTFPGEAVSKNLSLNNEDDDIIRPPPRLMNRRSSIDGKSEKNQEPLSLPKNNKSQSPTNKFSFENKKEQPPRQRQQLRLSLDEPKIEPIAPHKRQQNNSLKVRFAEKEKQQVKTIEAPAPKYQKPIVKQEKPIVRQQKPKKGLDMHIDQSITILKDSPGPSQQYNKQTIQQYQKQIEQIKLTFQKQVDFLQDNLDRQIVINRETRDKLMRESNKMIEDQRARMKKMQEEEIKRLKEMFQWQKKRMEDSYQIEINNLRQNLQYAQKNNNYTFKTSSTSREDVQYLETQLKHQKKLIEDRQRILQKREMELSERQNQLNKRRKKEEERLRQEQKRILENQMKVKKQLLEQKRLLNEQKQEMAIQVANLQIQAMKRREKADYSMKQNRMERQGLENQRFQLRNQNAELIARYKAKVEEVQNQKTRVRQIQADLIKKLRIVEQRLKDSNTSAVNKTMYTKKQNNWIEDRDKSHQNLRSFSIEKHEGSKPVPTNQTKDRFYQLESNTKHKMTIEAKQNKKFDLDNYMMTVQQYKRMRGQA